MTFLNAFTHTGVSVPLVRLVGVVLSNNHTTRQRWCKAAGQRRHGRPASTEKAHGKGCTKEVSHQRRRARHVRTDKKHPAHTRTVEQSVHIVSNESREGECLDTEEEAELEEVQ